MVAGERDGAFGEAGRSSSEASLSWEDKALLAVGEGSDGAWLSLGLVVSLLSGMILFCRRVSRLGSH